MAQVPGEDGSSLQHFPAPLEPLPLSSYTRGGLNLAYLLHVCFPTAISMPCPPLRVVGCLRRDPHTAKLPQMKKHYLNKNPNSSWQLEPWGPGKAKSPILARTELSLYLQSENLLATRRTQTLNFYPSRRLRLRGGSSGRHISSYAMPPETVSSIPAPCS